MERSFLLNEEIAIVNNLHEDLAKEFCLVSSDTPTFTKLTSGFESDELPVGMIA